MWQDVTGQFGANGAAINYWAQTNKSTLLSAFNQPPQPKGCNYMLENMVANLRSSAAPCFLLAQLSVYQNNLPVSLSSSFNLSKQAVIDCKNKQCLVDSLNYKFMLIASSGVVIRFCLSKWQTHREGKISDRHTYITTWIFLYISSVPSLARKLALLSALLASLLCSAVKRQPRSKHHNLLVFLRRSISEC